MDSQIQIQPIQSVDVTLTTEKIETDGDLFESMMNHQSPEESKKDAEQLTSSSQEKQLASISDTEKKEEPEEPALNILPPFMIEMIQQEATISLELGIERETLDTIVEKSRSSEVVLTPKEQAVVDQILSKIETKQSEQIEITSSVNQQIGEKIENPVFYQKNVWDVLHKQSVNVKPVNSIETEATSLSKSVGDIEAVSSKSIQVVPETKGPELSTYLNQLNRKPLVEENIPLAVTKNEIESNEGLNENTKIVTSSNEEVNKLPLRTEQQPTLSNDDSKLTTFNQFSSSNVSPIASIIDNETIANTPIQPVVTKEDIDVIRSMVTETIQNPGKPDTVKSTIQLTPETLGKMTVEIELVDDKLIGRLVVATEEAKGMVERQFKAQALLQPTQQALQIDKLEVTVQPTQQSFDAAFSFSDQQRQSNFSQPSKSKKNYNSDRDTEGETIEGTERITSDSRSINVMA